VLYLCFSVRISANKLLLLLLVILASLLSVTEHVAVRCVVLCPVCTYKPRLCEIGHRQQSEPLLSCPLANHDSSRAPSLLQLLLLLATIQLPSLTSLLLHIDFRARFVLNKQQ